MFVPRVTPVYNGLVGTAVRAVRIGGVRRRSFLTSGCRCAACNPLLSQSVSPDFLSHTSGRFYSGHSGTSWSSGGSGVAKVRESAGTGGTYVGGRFYSGSSQSRISWSSGSGDAGKAEAGAFNPDTMSLGINASLTKGAQKPSIPDPATVQTSIPELFAQNRAWSQRVSDRDPGFFETLAKQQSPKYLWIGCSDSRVPANEVVDLRPGEIFVHRNVANVVVHSDLNCLSVIQYAVDALRVEHIILCGHYGCGGVKAALNGNRLGLIDNWLRHIVDVRDKHKFSIEQTPYPEQLDLLCELNVIEQAVNVCETTVVQNAWERGQNLEVHSWIYGIDNGLLKDLGLHVSMSRELEPKYEAVMKRYSVGRV